MKNGTASEVESNSSNSEDSGGGGGGDVKSSSIKPGGGGGYEIHQDKAMGPPIRGGGGGGYPRYPGQQTGPTPTLNQLLQAPNPVPRYPPPQEAPYKEMDYWQPRYPGPGYPRPQSVPMQHDMSGGKVPQQQRPPPSMAGGNYPVPTGGAPTAPPTGPPPPQQQQPSTPGSGHPQQPPGATVPNSGGYPPPPNAYPPTGQYPGPHRYPGQPHLGRPPHGYPQQHHAGHYGQQPNAGGYDQRNMSAPPGSFMGQHSPQGYGGSGRHPNVMSPSSSPSQSGHGGPPPPGMGMHPSGPPSSGPPPPSSPHHHGMPYHGGYPPQSHYPPPSTATYPGVNSTNSAPNLPPSHPGTPGPGTPGPAPPTPPVSQSATPTPGSAPATPQPATPTPAHTPTPTTGPPHQHKEMETGIWVPPHANPDEGKESLGGPVTSQEAPASTTPTPTSSAQGPGGAAPPAPSPQQRPIPSPTGPTPMSPAVGVSQANIPMPPRPTSSQSEGTGASQNRHSQSPMAQGYTQGMQNPNMGPPMYGGAKMHPSMMGPYQNQPQQGYPQGAYGRQPNMSMQGYNQTSGYPGGPQPGNYGRMGPGGYPGPQGPPHGPPPPGPPHGPYMNSSGYPGSGYGIIPHGGKPGMGPQPMGGQNAPPPHMVSGPNSSSHVPANAGPGMSPMPPNTSAPRPSMYGAKQQVGQHKMGIANQMGGSGSYSTPPYGPAGSLGPGPPTQGQPPHPNMHSAPPGAYPSPPVPGHMGSGHMPPHLSSPSPHGSPGHGSPHHPGTGSAPPNMHPNMISNTTGGMLPPPHGNQQPSTQPTSVDENSNDSGPRTPSGSEATSPRGMGPPVSNSNTNNYTSNAIPNFTMTRHSPSPAMSSSSGSLSTHPPPPSNESSNSNSGPQFHDEASQQSTASTASTVDDRSETPRPGSQQRTMPPPTSGRGIGDPSHPPTPGSTLPSPGQASMSSYHDDFDSVSSPSWPRTPASPVINNQMSDYHGPPPGMTPHHPSMGGMPPGMHHGMPHSMPPGSFKRPDALLKLYEINDDQERRPFLDRLLQFNEERGSPITQCPTISKHPLDLYKLYVIVKERGGFIEVSKAKLWKDVAGLIGIGASSSGAYTLRKQYMKHMLPYECHFDRGGIDPIPIIQQVENSSRKKGKGANHLGGPGVREGFGPSPVGSIPPSVSSGHSMDGYPSAPGPTPYPTPPSQYSQPSAASEYDNSHRGPPPPPPQPHHPAIVHPPPPSQPGDSINVQNPFADEVQPTYSRAPIQHGYHGYGGGTMGQRSPYPGGSQPSHYTTPPGPYGPPEHSAGHYPPPPPPPPPPVGDPNYRRPQDSTGSYSPAASPYGPPRPQGQYPTYGNQYDRERYDPLAGQPVRAQPPPQSAVPPPTTQVTSSVTPVTTTAPVSNTTASSTNSDSQMAPRFPGPSPMGMPPRPPYPPTSVPPVSQTPAGPTNSQVPPPTPVTTAPSTPLPQPVPSTPMAPSQQYGSSGEAYPGYNAPNPGMYPPNKVIPPPGVAVGPYPPGPKRHPDFMKPGENPQYGYGQMPGQSPYPGYQAPYSSPYMGPGGSVPNSGPGTSPAMAPHPNTTEWSRGPMQQPPPTDGAVPPWCPPTGSRMPVPSPYSPAGGYGGPPMCPPGPGGASSLPPPGMSPMPGGAQSPMMAPRMRGLPPRDLKQMLPQTPQQYLPGSPAKQFPSALPPVPPSQSLKRDIQFPPECVESVAPVMVKRRRLTARDIGSTDPWRVMLALKSGLLTETTWAMDVLNVLLCDDNAILYFSLQHFPGLLDVLLEHYRRCLREVFGSVDDFNKENTSSAEFASKTYLKERAEQTEEEETDPTKRWYTLSKDTPAMPDIGIPEGENSSSSSGGKDHTTAVLKDTKNFTMCTRWRKTVGIVYRKDLFVLDSQKDWDILESRKSERDPWNLNPNENYDYILTCFESDEQRVPFVRVMKGSGKKRKVVPDGDTVGKKLKVEAEELTIERTESSDGGESAGKVIVNGDENQEVQCVPKEDQKETRCMEKVTKERKCEEKPECNGILSSDPESNDGDSDIVLSKSGSNLKTCWSSVTKNTCVKNENEKTGGCNAAGGGCKDNHTACLNVLDKCSNDLSTSLTLNKMIKKEPESDESCTKGRPDLNKSIDVPLSIDTKSDEAGEQSELKRTADENANIYENLKVIPGKSKLEMALLSPTISSLRSRSRCVDKDVKLNLLVRRDPNIVRRQWQELEEEAYTRDEPSLFLMNEKQDSLSRRCLAVSNILRSLTFVPGNDTELSKTSALLYILGKLLLLHHDHPMRKPSQHACDKEDSSSNSSALPLNHAEISADGCSSLHGENEWWWDTLQLLRENALVMLANIAGQLDLGLCSEEIALPILDGLLHWAVCPAAIAKDPFPGSTNASVSPRRLALETLCKLSVMESNVDLILATPPVDRLTRLLNVLTRKLAKHRDQVLREFAVVLLYTLTHADSGVASLLAVQPGALSLLLMFVEHSIEQTILMPIPQPARDRFNTECVETMVSIDMVRKAAAILLAIAQIPSNRLLFLTLQPRLLSLVMSPSLDSSVAVIIADVMYECSLPASGLS